MTTSAAHRMPVALQRHFEQRRRLVQQALARALPRASAYPPVIHQAMRYSVLGGGKRLRGILCLAACEAVGGRTQDALASACALECIHAYSLVHDDLPAMDDAATRRGQPACHRRYGEGIAILAGDALLSLGFELLARGNHAPRRLQVLAAVADVTGTSGLIGGQVMDLAWQQRKNMGSDPQLLKSKKKQIRGSDPMFASRNLMEYINAHKTAKLMSVCAKVGALLGGGTPAHVRALERYGFEVGVAFQLTDDLLDGEGMAALIGEHAARVAAQRAALRAQQHVRRLGRRAEPLCALAESIVWRTT